MISGVRIFVSSLSCVFLIVRSLSLSEIFYLSFRLYGTLLIVCNYVLVMKATSLPKQVKVASHMGHSFQPSYIMNNHFNVLFCNEKFLCLQLFTPCVILASFLAIRPFIKVGNLGRGIVLIQWKPHVSCSNSIIFFTCPLFIPSYQRMYTNKQFSMKHLPEHYSSFQSY